MFVSPPFRSPGRRESALPLAVFRILFGACLAIDIAGLIEFAPLWFDDVPHFEPARAPVVPLLGAWWLAAIGLMLGCFTRVCAVVNYVMCVAFLGFAAMSCGYEYHCDNMYILTSFGVLFMPVSRVLSIDAWRAPPADVTVSRAPGVFLALIVSGIYLDSAVWKLSSQLWLAGLGYWLPAVQPYEAQLALPWTLENEWIARGAGYLTLAYELSFVALVWVRRIRVPLLLLGLALHVGIGTVIPLPLFGLLMTALLAGLVPWPAPSSAPVARATRAPRALTLVSCAWVLAFALLLLEPLAVLARHGVGGVRGPLERPWHVTQATPAARACAWGQAWGYRLFGLRSHPIFIDSQFAGVDTQTRLRYHAPGAREGRPFHRALRNRRWVAWDYRTVFPEMRRELVEAQLARFAAYYAGHHRLDLEGGFISIEQRAVELPVDAWEPRRFAANHASPWRRVGVLRGAPHALTVQWEGLAER